MGLEEVLKLAIQYKALKIKVGDIEIALDASAFHVEQTRIAVPIGEVAGMPTEDELLFWSSGGIDIKTEPPEGA